MWRLWSGFLALLLSAWPAGADPWERAAVHPEGSGSVLAWQLSQEVDLLPFWRLALRIDEDAEPEERLGWGALLAGSPWSLETWLSCFDGSGSWSTSWDGASHQLHLGLQPGHNLEAPILERMLTQLRSDGRWTVALSARELRLQLGPPSASLSSLEHDPGFQAARQRLGAHPSQLLLYLPGPSPHREHLALTVDLRSQVAHGFWKRDESSRWPRSSGLDRSLWETRPQGLHTVVALDAGWLAQSWAALTARWPSTQAWGASFWAARQAPGALLDVLDGRGLVGHSENPTALLLGVAPSGTLYAAGRYRQLTQVESFLEQLEYDTRLATLEGCHANLEDLAWALARWEVDLGRPIPQNLEDLVPEKLSELPACPSAGRPTYRAHADPEQGRVVVCQGHHHPQTPPDYPRHVQREGIVRGPLQATRVPPADSRVQPDGAASYQLCTGANLSVDTRRGTVHLADGALAREFLDSAQSSTGLALPPLAQENLDWGGGALVYLDHVDWSDGWSRLVQASDQAYPGTTELLLQALVVGQRQAGQEQASNAIRQEKDGLAFRSSGLWASPALLAPVAALPVAWRAQRRQAAVARAQECRQQVADLAEALHRYAQEQEGRYPERLASLVPRYLPRLPHCPVALRDTYSASYHWDQYSPAEPHSAFFFVGCQGSHHRPARWEENQPSYQSERGLDPPQAPR